MSAFLFGVEGGVPSGYVKCPAGTSLLRGHTPGISAAWFGPPLGSDGENRFDMPRRASPAAPGTCYLAAAMEGVVLERVIRDVWRPILSLRTMKTQHAVAGAVLRRDLILVDLIKTAYTVHRQQVHQLNAPPPYDYTRALAQQLVANCPADIDGIAYTSRFGSGVECIALWDRAASALSWSPSEPLGQDENRLASACLTLGIGLLP